jgi:hypothetical protein
MFCRASLKISGWGGQTHTITIPEPPDQPPSAATTPTSLPGAMTPLQGSTPPQPPAAACTACRSPPPGGAAAAEPDSGDGGWLSRIGWRRRGSDRVTSPTAAAAGAAAGGVRSSRGSAGGAACPRCSSSSSQVVRLVQVLSPALVGRAHVWGNKLAIRSTWVCVDAPYFEAPGAG